jgi:putative transposase
MNMGAIVEYEWMKTSSMRRKIELDEFIIMPNHIHGIIIINECRGVLQYAPTTMQTKHETIFQSPSNTIGAFIRGYKSAVTKQINALRQKPGVPVWQRNYYEHVIRSDNELNRVREYIINNPINWHTDENNPVRAYCNTLLRCNTPLWERRIRHGEKHRCLKNCGR